MLYNISILCYTISSYYFIGESDANMAGIISSDPERGRESRETILFMYF